MDKERIKLTQVKKYQYKNCDICYADINGENQYLKIIPKRQRTSQIFVCMECAAKIKHLYDGTEEMKASE